jgi:hypothetical protein
MGLFTTLFGLNDDIAAGEEADRRNRELTEDLRRRGLITEDEYQTALDHYAADDAAGYYEDQLQRDFELGLDEGAANIRGFVGGTINTVVGTPLKLIPWQLWLILGLWLAWQLGWLNKLAGKVRS